MTTTDPTTATAGTTKGQYELGGRAPVAGAASGTGATWLSAMVDMDALHHSDRLPCNLHQAFSLRSRMGLNCSVAFFISAAEMYSSGTARTS